MDTPRSHSLDEINTIFVHLDRRDVEQFYASYQLWLLQQHIVEVQAQIQSVTQQIAENQEHLQRVHPSAIALAILARLQSNGVNNIDLLDRMLARGEDWLDRTMQRLAYCEKFDFIRDNYTDWCEHALEGAYDWIDSVDEAQIEHGTSPSPAETSVLNTLSDAAVDAQAQTTEEMLLLKLMSDEDEALMQAATLKIAAISPAQAQEDVEPTVLEQEQEGSTEHTPSPVPTDHIPTMEEIIPLESNEAEILPIEQPAEPVEVVEVVQAEYIPTHDVRVAENDGQITPEERIEVEEQTTTPTDEEMDASSPSTSTSVPTEQVATPETSQQSSLQSTRPRRKRSFLRRLITAFLGI
ncbi:MAG: hypothetical protein ABI396_06780 [Ktedonobacteraceae bacterium]